MRSDLNVPLDGDRITDDGRVRAALPTIKKLADAGAKVVVTAHLGRPKGKRDPKQSLRPVGQRLAEILGRPVAFVDDCIGEKAEKTVELLQPGDVLLLENLRYYKEEEANDPGFAIQR